MGAAILLKVTLTFPRIRGNDAVVKFADLGAGER